MTEKQSSKEELICLDEIDLRDWANIKTLARQMYDAGEHNKDQFKCNVHAFLTWLIQSNKVMAYEIQEGDLKEKSDDSRFFDLPKPDKGNLH